MTTAELIEELQRHPPHTKVEVFVDWPKEPEEQSGWFQIDKVRQNYGAVEISLEQ